MAITFDRNLAQFGLRGPQVGNNSAGAVQPQQQQQNSCGAGCSCCQKGQDSFGMNDPQSINRIAQMMRAMLGPQGVQALQQALAGGANNQQANAVPDQPGRDLGSLNGQNPNAAPRQRRARRAQRSQRTQRSRQARQARQPRQARQTRTNNEVTGAQTQQQGIPAGLRPNAAQGARVAREMGFTGVIGGIGHRSGPSDHPHGNAIDVMTMNNRAQGREIAERFRRDHAQLGVKYVIFEQQIASPRTGWQWQPMPNRGNPTANHFDHVHVSFR